MTQAVLQVLDVDIIQRSVTNLADVTLQRLEHHRHDPLGPPRRAVGCEDLLQRELIQVVGPERRVLESLDQ